MPTMTQPDRPSTGPGGARLPRPATQPSRGREIALGLLGVLGIATLVLAIPAALVAFVGYPLPRSAPTRDWLTTSINATLIIKALACVVWVVWAHFVVCLLSEWRAIRRGRMPSVVPLGGGSQLLARRLVATALLLSGAAMLVPHGGSGPSTSTSVAAGTHNATAAVSVASPSTGTTRPATFDTSKPFAANVFGPDSTIDDSTAAAAQATTQTKFYVVHPPQGRHHDSLWDIAGRTLGDPLRYKEIYALNHARTQADGSKLTDANLIRPGWQLILPADATGPGVHVVTQAAAPLTPDLPAPKPYGTPSTPESSAEAPLAAPTPGGPAVQESPTTAFTQQQSPDRDLGANSVVGGSLLVAGLAVAASGRRGPYVSPASEEQLLLAGGSPELAELLDKALRNLAYRRREQARPLPHLAIAWLAPTQIVLSFMGGDVADPPAPWRVGEEERSWLLNPAELTGPFDAAAPYPGLVNVGTGHGYEVLIDLEQAPGLISVGGITDVAREIVSSLAIQPTLNTWSDGARVTFIGFADAEAMRQISPHSITIATDVAQAITQVSGDREDRVKIQRELGIDGVLTGRQNRKDLDWRPSLIVLSAPPSAEEALQLHDLTQTERGDVIAIVVGDAPSARWRFAADMTGSLDLGVFGTSVKAHRLSPASAASLAAMLQGADRARVDADREVRAMTPATAIVNRPYLPRQSGVAAATIRLLGPVRVSAPGPLRSGTEALATEIIVAISLAEDGLHDAVLRSSIWQRGVSDTVAASAMADAAEWLGTAADGTPRIQQGADGLWRLSSEVHSDVVTLRQRVAAAQGTSEIDSLQGAIALFAGEGFSVSEAGRYAWPQFAAAARDTNVLATTVVCRLVDLLQAAGRMPEAAAALRSGLILIPTSEVLWQRLLSLPAHVVSPSDPTNGSRVVADEMYATLHAHGVWPDPQTDALVSQVIPGYETAMYVPSRPALV